MKETASAKNLLPAPKIDKVFDHPVEEDTNRVEEVAAEAVRDDTVKSQWGNDANF